MRENARTAALLPAVTAGEDHARAELIALWGPTVLRWCARLGGPGIDEEDAAHDVFERVLEKIDTLQAVGAFSSWLFQTTRRVVGDHRRRAWLRRWVPGRVPEVPDPREGAGRQLETAELGRRVMAVLDRLPGEYREVLVLAEIEERDGSEVAALLGVPLGTMRSRLRRGRALFEAEARRQGLGEET